MKKIPLITSGILALAYASCAPLATTPPDVPVGGTIYPARPMTPPPANYNSYRPAPKPDYSPGPAYKPNSPGNKPSNPAPSTPAPSNPAPNNKPSGSNGNAVISHPTTQPSVNTNVGNRRNPGTGLNIGNQGGGATTPAPGNPGTGQSTPPQNGGNRR